eukprot:TRINITY_DN49894_c0_g1_i1.p1 TRINITY_DN49894_c0_g1~~TRINITY_DN49894_c0_g1_i1.p1  ORF type:complete len:115 (+),score=26.39 TRINITY_DN49894_c0_g1_i1:362-706(+)
MKLEGRGPWEIAGFQVHHTPGHSPGSLFYTFTSLSTTFSGDSVGFWNGRVTEFPNHCRFSRELQAASLLDYASTVGFCSQLFPGHGQPMTFTSPEQRMETFYAAAAEFGGSSEV